VLGPPPPSLLPYDGVGWFPIKFHYWPHRLIIAPTVYPVAGPLHLSSYISNIRIIQTFDWVGGLLVQHINAISMEMFTIYIDLDSHNLDCASVRVSRTPQVTSRPYTRVLCRPGPLVHQDRACAAFDTVCTSCAYMRRFPSHCSRPTCELVLVYILYAHRVRNRAAFLRTSLRQGAGSRQARATCYTVCTSFSYLSHFSRCLWLRLRSRLVPGLHCVSYPALHFISLRNLCACLRLLLAVF
jgi:hypothetical protein